MRNLFLLCCALLISLLNVSAAESTNSAPPGMTENRYLLIIESSAETSPMKDAVKNVAMNLLVTGMDGRLKEGDTIGLWSYGPELEVANISMQRWSTSGPPRKVVLETTGKLISELKFKKPSNFAKVTPALLSVAKSSRRLIITIISSGKETVTNTPYDREIKDIVEYYRKDLKSAKIPFVTFLAVHEGEFIGYSVNSAVGPFQIPTLPEEPKPIEPAKVVVAPPAPAVPTPNIEIRGTKAVLPVETTPLPAPVVDIPPPVQAIQVAAEIAKPVPTAVTLEVPITEPPPAKTESREQGSAPPAKVIASLEETNSPSPVVQAVIPPPNAVNSGGTPAWAAYAGALFIVMAIAAFMLGRRTAKPPQPSLISRSMNEK